MGVVSTSSTDAYFLLLLPTNKYRVLSINFEGGSDNVTQYNELETLEGIEDFDDSLTNLYAVKGYLDIFIHHTTDTTLNQSYSSSTENL